MRRAFISAFLIAACLPWLQARPANAAAFSDIDAAHPYADAIGWLKEKGYVNGFSDGSFRADRTITRAEALKIIVAGAVPADDIAACDTKTVPYSDVPAGSWFAPYVCTGVAKGFIVPGEDGLFRPGDTLNLAEMASIVTRVEEIQHVGTDDQWFAPAIRALGRMKAIPGEMRAYGEFMTRGQLAEMLWRVKNAVTDRDAADPESLIVAQCEWFAFEDIPGVDEQEVTRAWMQWVNGERAANGLPAYRIDKQLARTASVWSSSARNIGTITHKRAGQAAYYDYGIMTDWFSDNGLTFANDGGSTFTENIGWGVYRCAEGKDCTGDFIKAVRTTFDFFMSEKGKAYRPHYNSIVNGEFKHAGLGISVDPASRRYYLTAHYATEVTSTPDPICP